VSTLCRGWILAAFASRLRFRAGRLFGLGSEVSRGDLPLLARSSGEASALRLDTEAAGWLPAGPGELPVDQAPLRRLREPLIPALRSLILAAGRSTLALSPSGERS